MPEFVALFTLCGEGGVPALLLGTTAKCFKDLGTALSLRLVPGTAATDSQTLPDSLYDNHVFTASPG